MSSPFVWVILGFVPAGVLSLAMEIFNRISQQRGLREPVSDKLLRPPGESCRRKIEEIDDKLAELTLWLVGFPATILVCYVSNNRTGAGPKLLVWILCAIIGSAFTGGVVWKILKLVKERDNWRLGYRGELFVGQQINQLMLEGCRVFHDVPLGEKGNIDHVVVGPTGVFAIETKAKRKGAASETQQAHEVIYDGNSLQFPFYRDTRDLDQARTQADRLEKLLSPLLLEPAAVQPILTLPGWFVISRALGDVIVVNPKMVEAAILSPSPNPLSPGRIREISYILDQKCRDMEF